MQGAASIQADPFDRPDEFGRAFAKKSPAGSLDSLIDAEREAMARDGRAVNRLTLILALRRSSGLDWRGALRAVDGFFAREGDLARRKGPTAWAWIDDLLDTECSAVSKAGLSITKLLLVKTLRAASGLDRAEAEFAVEDYHARRGAMLPADAFVDLPSSRIDERLDAKFATSPREDWGSIQGLLILNVCEATGRGWSESRRVVESYLDRKLGADRPRTIGPAGPMGRLAAIVMMPLFCLVGSLLALPLGSFWRVMLLVYGGLGVLTGLAVGLKLLSRLFPPNL